MVRDISPEEKLLRLIRRGKKQTSSQDIPQAFPEPTTSLKPPLKELKSRYPGFQIQHIKRLLFIVLFISSAYLVISFLWPIFFIKEINIRPILETEPEIIKEESPPEVKPYSFYQDTTASRQIFGSPLAELTKSSQTSSDAVGMDIIKDFNLLGIISGENPQAIIEDKKTQKTYYLSKGQSIGEFQVEDIQEGKIILIYKGQRFELYL